MIIYLTLFLSSAKKPDLDLESLLRGNKCSVLATENLETWWVLNKDSASIFVVRLDKKEIQIQYAGSDKVKMAPIRPTIGYTGFYFVEENIET